MGAHSHRHIGDIVDVDYLDPGIKFIVMQEQIYLKRTTGKPAKRLSGYGRITIDFKLPQGHSYTAVYHRQSRLKHKNSTGYALIRSEQNPPAYVLDVCSVPSMLYVLHGEIEWKS